MKKIVLLLIITAFAVLGAYAQDCSYLTDPELKDISNNHSNVMSTENSFELKFRSSSPFAYFVLFPEGADTVMLHPDSLGIFRIKLNPSIMKPGNYFTEVLDCGMNKRLNFSFSIKKPVNYYDVLLKVLLGLIFFMMGLNFASRGLSRISGYRMKELLWNMSESPFKGIAAGFILTMMLQSSTAFSVMVTSFVSDGLIGIIGAVAMMAGSAIGTSMVVQIIAFNISFFAILMIIAGFLLYDRVKKLKYTGQVLLGFGLVFFAIQTMAGAMAPVQDTEMFQNAIMFLRNNLVLLFILTTLFTFSVHSSAVIIAIVMSFVLTGLMPFRASIIMIAAANVGTTLTATLATFRGSSKARYAALMNFTFKLFAAGVFIFLAMFFAPKLSPVFNNPRGIANLHLIMNIGFAIIIISMIPVIRYFSRFVKSGELTLVSKRILTESITKTPDLALGHIMRELTKMGEIANNMLSDSFNIFRKNDSEGIRDILRKDDVVDQYEKEITYFLVSLSEEEIPQAMSSKVRTMLFIVDEIEHIGDTISKNIMLGAKKKINENYYFSGEGFDDLKLMHAEVLKTFTMVLSLLNVYDKTQAEIVLDRRESVLALLDSLHKKHLARLQNDMKESLETSTLHLDILNDYERINFHAYRICVSLTEMNIENIQGER